MFQHFSVLFSRLIDSFFTYLLNINIMETWTEGIKSSYYEEFRIFKFKLALIKIYENRKYFIFG